MIINADKVESLISELWSYINEFALTERDEGRMDAYITIANELRTIIDDSKHMKKKTTWKFSRMHPTLQMLFRAAQYTLASIGLLALGFGSLVFMNLMLVFLQSL